MMDRKGIQAAVINRLDAMEGSCNSAHLDHNDGVLRGLLWALTGEDPGTYLTRDTRRVLDMAGFDTRMGEDGLVHWTERD